MQTQFCGKLVASEETLDLNHQGEPLGIVGFLVVSQAWLIELWDGGEVEKGR